MPEAQDGDSDWDSRNNLVQIESVDPNEREKERYVCLNTRWFSNHRFQKIESVFLKFFRMFLKGIKKTMINFPSKLLNKRPF